MTPSTDLLARDPTLLGRMGSKFLVGDDHWIWTGADNNHDYGQILADGRNQLAHRVMYELLVGPIPAGMELDHLCCVPRCIRPDHLEPVTHAENMRRYGERLTHCAHGHELTSENLYVYPNGRKECRLCRRITLRRFYENRRRQYGAIPFREAARRAKEAASG